MEKFTLLVDGKDLDTGVYEYFPYADKYIADFKTTFKITTQLKLGKLQEDSPEVKEYIFAKYCIAKEDTNQKAIEAAYKAFQQFRYFPLEKRKKILCDIHKNLVEKKEKLIELFIIEGHPKKLAEWEISCMERGYRNNDLEYFKNEVYKKLAEIKNDKTTENVFLIRRPDGVVCVSPPKNAPCSNSLIAAYSLLVGNTLVIKPPLNNPLATIYLWKEIVWKAVKDNGGPDGTINIVIGNSKKITDEWLTSPYVNDIIFFGNSEKGVEMGRQIYLAGKKPILELSGNDMMLIWKDAKLEEATDALLDGFLGSTQICMVPKKAFIHQDIYDVFVEKFLQKAKNLKIGLPSDPEVILTPVILIQDFFKFLDDALTKGAKLLCGGKRVNYKGEEDKNGIYLTPTVISIEDTPELFNYKCIKEENFFPLLPLVKIKGKNDEEIFTRMVEIVNKNEYGLRISVWVSSDEFIEKFVSYLHNSGLLRINSKHVEYSAYLATHGGVGKTGGPFGELNYVWQKTSHLQGISIFEKEQ